MKNSQLQSTLAEIAEQAIPSTEIDLWTGMRRHLATSESNIQQGDASMKTNFFRTPTLRRAALILAAVTVGLAILFATPQGQAFAQSLLHFFTRTQGDTIPAPTGQPLRWVDRTTPGAPTLTPLPSPTGFAFADDCGNLPILKCSIEQIRGKVHFTIKELGTIPKGLYFVGATGGPQMIIIVYDSPDHSGALSLVEQPWTGSPEQTNWQIGASAVVETAAIGNVSGEYVKGSYGYTAGDTTEIWDANSDTQSLHWVEEGVFFQMSASGPQLDKAAFIALAEGLTIRPVSAGSPPMPTETPDTETYAKAYVPPLTVVEAGKQAGFDIREPTLLPEFLLLEGAAYEEQDKIARVSYQSESARSQGLMNGLFLSEQVALNPDDCKLCGILVGDNTAMDKDPFHMIVSPKSNLETVQIGALTGQYVEGHWIRPDCCGWVWTAEDLKTLRWWKNGVAFELIELGTGMTKADVIAIAESMK